MRFLAVMAHRDLLVLLGLPASRMFLALLGLRVLLGRLALRGRLVLLLRFQVLRVTLVRWVLLDPRVPLVLRVLSAR